MFCAGDDVTVESFDAHSHDRRICRNGEQVGEIVCSVGVRTVDLHMGARHWPLRAYGRGWRVAAFDDAGRVAASYADRWMLPGALIVGPRRFKLSPPIWHDWRLTDNNGSRIIELEKRDRWWDVGGRVETLTEDTDRALLIGFAVAIVALRVRFSGRPMQSVHVNEGRADTLDGAFDGGDDGGGD